MKQAAEGNAESVKKINAAFKDCASLAATAPEDLGEDDLRRIEAIEVQPDLDQAVGRAVWSDAMRSQLDLLARFIALTKAGVAAYRHRTAVPVDGNVHLELKHFFCLSNAFQELLTTFTQWGGGDGLDFPATAHDARTLVYWCGQLDLSIENGWLQDLTASSDNLKEMVPPKCALEDGTNLTDDNACRLIRNHPKSDRWVPTVNEFSNKLSAIKDMQKVGLKVSKRIRQAHKDGIDVKKLGKTAIAVSFCLGKIKGLDSKASPDEMKTCGELCDAKVQKIGVVLPGYLQKMLSFMQGKKPGEESAEPSSRGEPAA